MHPSIVSTRFEHSPERLFAGLRQTMSYKNNLTAALWQRFMPLRRSVANQKSDLLYSLQCYPPDFFVRVNPDANFEKWALTEITGAGELPPGIETFSLPEGLYAVFHYRGSSANAPEVFGYIFGSWMPQSGYEADDRPHFEVLGEKYNTLDPLSEEEIWIPVKKR